MSKDKAMALEKRIAKLDIQLEKERKRIGQKDFKELQGHFWGFHETRPYMRVKASLADALWQIGKYGDAIKEYQEMITLNPSDNQGIRYLLITHYLELGMLEDFQKLIKQYDEESSTQWKFSLALYSFIKEGASENSNKALKLAIKDNPYVLDYLLGIQSLPKSLPDYYERGSNTEAISYVSNSLSAWKKHSDSIEWAKGAIL